MPYPPRRLEHWSPEWARDAVFYHIYPLGFTGAPAHNDRQSAPEPRLAGLRRWYDHITRLGVTALYFGPLFESHSHGYDTIDYFTIDRRLGDNSLIRQIVDELHERGIRVIFDGVFNHTGRGFFAFQDIVEYGTGSRYRDWYRIDPSGDSHYGDGFAYDSWEGHQSLPALNLANPDVRKYLFEVAQMWLSDVGIDGWRLDVAYELPHDFLWELRRVCKTARPDCLLLGETIHGDYRTWVAPDLLDAGLNYPFHSALVRSFNEANMHDLAANLDRAYHSEWGLYTGLMLVNFLGNHDVTRIRSLLDDPRHMFPALILLMSAPGVPMLYYGDELGMEGLKEEGDAALRRPMPDPTSGGLTADAEALTREIARLTALRNEHPALSRGRYATLMAQGPHYAFLRQYTRQNVIVAVSGDDAPAALDIPITLEGIPDGVRFHDALNTELPPVIARGGRVAIPDIPAFWGRLLVADM
jgi:cyclomaltodextrinase